MRIEKISRYISVTPGVSEPSNFGRRVLLSLPRVRWLEAQPDYQPWPPLPVDGPVSDAESGVAQDSEDDRKVSHNRYIFRPHLRRNELSVRQREAWDFYRSGLTMRQIGENMGCTSNAASKLVAQAREKLGVGLE